MQGNVNIPDSTITTNLSFRQLILMNMQQLTNFPYIEKDFDALTDYELLCLVVKFLNDVIANQNEQNNSITRMYQSFLALQDYVNNTKDTLEDAFNNLDNYVRYYFDNLDVQEEINNKLDQMLEDGVLTEIIQQFLQSTALWCFDTVADMKQATNLINGSYAKTLGYYSVNDGGGAVYKITDTASQTEYQEEVGSLYATLIINDNINPLCLGAYGDNIHDDTLVIQEAINIASETGKNVLISKGTYIIGEIDILENVSLIGTGGTLKVKDNLCIDNTLEYYPVILRNNSKIENVIINGNRENNLLYKVADLITTIGDNITIRGNRLYNIIDSGIMFSETINSICENNYIKDSHDCGIYCNNNNSNKIMNSIVKNNFIENSLTSGIALKRGCRNIDIVKNYLMNCTNGITNENASTDSDFSYEFNIIENTIISTENIKARAIETRGGHDLLIKNNRITNYSYNILINGSHNVDICDNIINLDYTTTLTTAHYGISLQGRSQVTEYNNVYNINIIGNIINANYVDSSGNNQRCITISNSNNTSNISIINNIVNTSSYGSCIRTDVGIGELIIKNNVFNGGSVTLQNSNVYVDNITTGTITFSFPQKISKGYYHDMYENNVTSTPTIRDFMKNGDIIFNRVGTNAQTFAWQLDKTNNTWKQVNFD